MEKSSPPFYSCSRRYFDKSDKAIRRIEVAFPSPAQVVSGTGQIMPLIATLYTAPRVEVLYSKIISKVKYNPENLQ